jgi:hypothetical protein
MRKNDKQRIVDEQRRRSDTEQQYRTAQLERGMSELAWLGSRLNAADLRAVQAADARGGLGAVRQILAGAGLTDAGFAALAAQYQRGGLNAVGSAVQAQITHERQTSAEQDAVAALEKLGPQEWAAAQQILATGGPEQLAHRAVAMGLSPEAAVAAARHLASNGVQQTRQAVTENAQARARADALRARAEKEIEAAKPWDPFGSVDIAQAALDLVTNHGPALEAAGVGLKKNESPIAWVRRLSNTADEATVAKVAKALGDDSLERAKTIVTTGRDLDLRGELLGRAAERDEDARRQKPNSPPDERTQARIDHEEARRAAISAKYDKVAQEGTRASRITEAVRAKQAEPRPAPPVKTSREALSDRYDALARGETSAPPAETSNDDEAERNSRSGVLSAAYDVIAGGDE